MKLATDNCLRLPTHWIRLALSLAPLNFVKTDRSLLFTALPVY
jgi:hypothetical protein